MKRDESNVFGSKAFNERHHGRNKDAKRSPKGLNRAERDKRRRAREKKDGAEFLEQQRREWLLNKKANQQQERILSKILKDGTAYAVKISLPDGTIGPEQLAEIRAAGWDVRPAGTISAKAGAGLDPIEPVAWENPTDDDGAILGRKLRARAIIVVKNSPISWDDVAAWRRAGYEVSPAPNPRAKVNPLPVAKKNRSKRDSEGQGETHANQESPILYPMDVATITKHDKNADGFADLEGIWNGWTGSKATQWVKLDLDDPGNLPKRVVMLGRLAFLVAKTGGMVEFRDGTGPLMVTDGLGKRLWLLSEKPRKISINMKGGLLSYYAKKPKLGDKKPLQYVHLFACDCQVTMNGQIGEIKGDFAITKRGIEG